MIFISDFLDAVKNIAVNAVETSKPTAILYGCVINVNPLEIRVDQKLILTEKFLVLSRNVTDFQTKISFDNPDIKQVYTTWDMEEKIESPKAKIDFKEKIKHDITIYNALKVGENVILMRCQGGQRFIVIDRVVSEV